MPQPLSTAEVLFQSIRINELLIRNRLVMGPIAAHSPAPDGRPSEKTIAFFAERAKGGIGLIIVGGTMSTTLGWDGSPTTQYYLRLDTDDFIPDLRRLTDAVHAHGTPIFAQINTSMGRMGKPGPNFIAASAVNVVIPKGNSPPGIIIPADIVMPVPREATLAEINLLEIETAESALRMRRANFDGIELGAHMSYFLASFLSPRVNRRTDRYGGSLENRTRVLVNIIRNIRAEAGRSFPIGVRMSVNEHLPDGLGPQGYAEIAQLLEREGVDYIAMTDGAYETMNQGVRREDAGIIEHGEAAIFRKAVSIPLMLQGVHDPERASKAITGGHTDMVMLARQMVADPEYPEKVRTGRTADITWCDRDNQCLHRLILSMPIRCTVNSRVGREDRHRPLPPLSRVVPGSIERAVLGLTGWAPAMSAVTAVTAIAKKLGPSKAAK